MRLVRDLDSEALCPGGCAVTLGNFDGLHVGHQALFQRTLAGAERLQVEAAALSFDPMPQEFFVPDDPPARLQRTSEKVAGLAAAGFDLLWLMRFNADVAVMSEQIFVDHVLARGLNARLVVVGSDFRYGRGRVGDVESLREDGREHGFEVCVEPPVMISDERVSSTRIRRALAQERFRDAAIMLGRPYRMSGRVTYGRRLGRDLGFPTVNLNIGRLRSPLQGIFAVWVYGVRARPLPGVASIGTRPTVEAQGDVILEVHLLDFDGDLYGRRLEVEFVDRLRAERKFDSVASMCEQMHRDVARARRCLQKLNR